MDHESTYRVLLIDDDEDDFLIVRSLLVGIPHVNFELDWVSDFAKAEQAIADAAHDVYLVDYRLGLHTGMDLLAGMNLNDRPKPFIILTGAGDEAIEREAMAIGVADYLVKGTFDSDLLSRALRYAIQRKSSETQRINQLKEINRSKDEFIALASHQLRTPATAVKQYLGMLLAGYAGDVTDDQMAMLRTANESNERQLAIVNDILRVARLDLDKVSLSRRRHSLNKIMKNILDDITPIAKERAQLITYSKPATPLYVWVDEDFFRMAISNIVDNASKYTPSGGQIVITVEQQNGGTTTIEVIDQGVGIAAEDMDKLFKKFSRIQNPLSVEVGGTGLGLYWANEVIELHGGTIQVSSRLGRGTSFMITLPARKALKAKGSKIPQLS